MRCLIAICIFCALVFCAQAEEIPTIAGNDMIVGYDGQRLVVTSQGQPMDMYSPQRGINDTFHDICISISHVKVDELRQWTARNEYKIGRIKITARKGPQETQLWFLYPDESCVPVYNGNGEKITYNGSEPLPLAQMFTMG